MPDPLDDDPDRGTPADNPNPFSPGADVPAEAASAAESQNRRLTMYGIMGAVAMFGVVVAAGAYRQTGKLMAIPIVLVTVGLFLTVWYVAWRLRVDSGSGSSNRGV